MPFVYAVRSSLRDRAQGPQGPARRQGGEPGRDDLGAQVAGAAWLHHHDRRLPDPPRDRRVARRARRRDRRPGRAGREGDGPSRRRRRQPVAPERAVRGQVLDARDDGHGPEPGPQRRVGAGPGPADRQRAVRPRLVPALHIDVRADRPGHRGRPVRQPLRRREAPGRGDQRRRGADRAPRLPGAALPAGRAIRVGGAVPPGPEPSAAHGGRGRVRFLEGRPRRRLPNPRAHPPRPGHGGERASDGVRQSGRHLGHRGRLHAQPHHRRADALRRLPGQRPGRGRGGRHPPHRTAGRAGRPVPCHPPTSWSTSSGGSSGTSATCSTPSSPSSRASSGCCRRAWASGPDAPHCASRSR